MTEFKTYEDWLKVVNSSLPHVVHYIEKQNLQTLIIGAALLELYKYQGWDVRITRKTGDLDLSIQVSLGGKEYRDFRSYLLAKEYEQSEPHKTFRFYPPEQKAVDYSYLDLLAHPGPGVSQAETRELMGVGPDWGFDTVAFGLHQPIPITDQIIMPNIFGFLLMKFSAWESNPHERARDLGDVVDVVYGIVSSGQHYEMGESWEKIGTSQRDAKIKLLRFLARSADLNDITIDFEAFETEFLQRQYRSEDLENEIPRHFKELLEVLQT